MEYDYGYCTKSFVAVPLPWDLEYPINMYCVGGVPWVTITFVLVGLGVSLALFFYSTNKWWVSFLSFVGINSFFVIMTFVGVIGCKGGGCALASVQVVALNWYLPLMLGLLLAFLLVGLIRFIVGMFARKATYR